MSLVLPSQLKVILYLLICTMTWDRHSPHEWHVSYDSLLLGMTEAYHMVQQDWLALMNGMSKQHIFASIIGPYIPQMRSALQMSKS